MIGPSRDRQIAEFRVQISLQAEDNVAALAVAAEGILGEFNNIAERG